MKELEKCGASEKLKPHALSSYIEDEKIQSMIASVNSRIGHIKHSRSWMFRKRTLDRLIFKTTHHLPRELGESYSSLRVNKEYLKIRKG